MINPPEVILVDKTRTIERIRIREGWMVIYTLQGSTVAATSVFIEDKNHDWKID